MLPSIEGPDRQAAREPASERRARPDYAARRCPPIFTSCGRRWPLPRWSRSSAPPRPERLGGARTAKLPSRAVYWRSSAWRHGIVSLVRRGASRGRAHPPPCHLGLRTAPLACLPRTAEPPDAAALPRGGEGARRPSQLLSAAAASRRPESEQTAAALPLDPLRRAGERLAHMLRKRRLQSLALALRLLLIR